MACACGGRGLARTRFESRRAVARQGPAQARHAWCKRTAGWPTRHAVAVARRAVQERPDRHPARGHGAVRACSGTSSRRWSITVIVVFAVVLGFVQEFRAERAIEALQEMAAPRPTVVRDGTEIELPAREVVPGDVLVLAAGDRVAADGRLLQAVNLKLQEAALTGESTPVEKHAETLHAGDAPVGDRTQHGLRGHHRRATGAAWRSSSRPGTAPNSAVSRDAAARSSPPARRCRSTSTGSAGARARGACCRGGDRRARPRARPAFRRDARVRDRARGGGRARGAARPS